MEDGTLLKALDENIEEKGSCNHINVSTIGLNEGKNE